MVRSKRLVVIVAAFVVLLVSGIFATGASAAEYPQVGGLKPFSEEARFMSLPGYLRWLVFQQDGVWIARAESVRIVKAQGGQLYVKESGAR